MQSPYFYEPSVASANAIITLGEDTSRHCIQVLRMKEGDRLQLINGKGSLYTALIVNADKKMCNVRIEDVTYQKQEGKKVCIAISPLKNVSRFEWFLEKAVEMGVQEIIPLLCARTEKQHVKMERLQSIVVSAMIQSRQVWLPLLRQPATFEEAAADSHSFKQKLIAHCDDDNRKLLLSSIPIENSVQMLIGPEGDFTEKEIETALQNGHQPVSLGATRLRTETAGVVASALLIYSHK